MALANPFPDEKSVNNEKRAPIQRTPEQHQNRVLRAKEFRQKEPLARPGMVSKNNAEANDRETEEALRLRQAQTQVDQARFVRAQSLGVAEESMQDEMIKAEGEKTSIIRFIPAGSVAVFKDLLDFTFIGSLPVIGTVISFFCGALIFLLLLFTKVNGGIVELRFILRRLLILLVTFIIEGFIFGVNFFPFQLATVALIYFMDRHLSEKQIALLQELATPFKKARL